MLAPSNLEIASMMSAEILNVDYVERLANARNERNRDDERLKILPAPINECRLVLLFRQSITALA